MDLETATLEQIFDELKKRYPGLLLVHESPAPGDDDFHHFGFLYHGGLTLGVGLARRAMAELLDGDETEWIDRDEGN